MIFTINVIKWLIDDYFEEEDIASEFNIEPDEDKIYELLSEYKYVEENFHDYSLEDGWVEWELIFKYKDKCYRTYYTIYHDYSLTSKCNYEEVVSVQVTNTKYVSSKSYLIASTSGNKYLYDDGIHKSVYVYGVSESDLNRFKVLQ